LRREDQREIRADFLGARRFGRHPPQSFDRFVRASQIEQVPGNQSLAIIEVVVELKRALGVVVRSLEVAECATQQFAFFQVVPACLEDVSLLGRRALSSSISPRRIAKGDKVFGLGSGSQSGARRNFQKASRLPEVAKRSQPRIQSSIPNVFRNELKIMPHATTATRPAADEYGPHFDRYIRLVPDGDVLETLSEQIGRTQALLQPLNEGASMALHAPYTWTLKQVLGHLTDCERIFGYRALRLARNDATALPGFDENQFMEFADFNAWPMSELLEEFTLVRRGHLWLLRHLSPEAWQRRGTVVGHVTTCRSLAYVMAGHAEHHLAILKERLDR
jgi:hypothetical protein